jgi:hypothetical protein
MLLLIIAAKAGSLSGGMTEYSNPDGTNAGSIEFDSQKLGDLFGASDTTPGNAVPSSNTKAASDGKLSLTVKQHADVLDATRLLRGDDSATAGAELLKFLKEFADQYGVNITSISNLPEKKSDGFTKVTMRIETVCNMESFVRYLAAIENCPKYLTIEEVSIYGFRTPSQKKYEIRPGLTIAGYTNFIEDGKFSEIAAGNLGKKDRNLEILRELTLVLPRDTYLNAYTNHDGTIHLVGLSGSASDLIPKLESSPLFNEVRAKAPFRNLGDKDLFVIEAKLKN